MTARLIRTFFVLAVASAFATAAHAAKPYVGFRGGFSDTTTALGDGGGAAELFGGVTLSRHWSLEAGLLAHRASYRESTVGLAETDDRAGVDALTVALRGEIPIADRWTAHARGGVGWYRLESGAPIFTRVSDTLVAGQLEEEKHTSFGHQVAIGIETSIDARARWRAGAELQHHRAHFELSCTPPCAFDRKSSLNLLVLSVRRVFD